MKIGSFAALATIGAVVLLTQGLVAEAAEIKVISAGGFGTLMHILGPQFERATGNTLAIKFVDGPKGSVKSTPARHLTSLLRWGVRWTT
jgi:ABC-type molybdate transport system substrate-binding protein